MISIPRFHDLLVGMAPVILGPREVEPVRFGAFTFHQRHAPMEGALWQPTRLYWPDPYYESPIIAPEIQDIPRNPVRPAWRRSGFVWEVPHPAAMPPLHSRWYDAQWYDAGNGHLYLMDSRYFSGSFALPPDFFGRSVVDDLIGLQGLVDDGIRAPLMATRGDEQSTVPADTIETLVDLAREGNRDDFMFLAGASGVRPEQHEELWAGTRRRLGLP